MTNPGVPGAPTTPLSRIPFSPRAEASIVELSKWMRIAGVITIVGAVIRVLVLVTVRNDLGQAISAFITFLIGMWTLQAATAFRAVATTDTADQRNLMQAFAHLRRVFLVQATLVIVGLAVVLVGVIGAAIFFLAR